MQQHKIILENFSKKDPISSLQKIAMDKVIQMHILPLLQVYGRIQIDKNNTFSLGVRPKENGWEVFTTEHLNAEKRAAFCTLAEPILLENQDRVSAIPLPALLYAYEKLTTLWQRNRLRLETLAAFLQEPAHKESIHKMMGQKIYESQCIFPGSQHICTIDNEGYISVQEYLLAYISNNMGIYVSDFIVQQCLAIFYLRC